MSLNANTIDEQLTDSYHAETNISASCQGILSTKINSTDTAWYQPLNQGNCINPKR